jgi:hypothetical protein
VAGVKVSRASHNVAARFADDFEIAYHRILEERIGEKCFLGGPMT